MAKRVFVGVGSNIEPERHIEQALLALVDRFGSLRVSPAYRSAPVGFDGEDFINLVIELQSELAPSALVDTLHGIEAACGRRRDSARFAPRALDLDLLMVGQQISASGSHPELPRGEILRYAFVLRPLAELAPDLRHPEAGESMQALWVRHRASIDQGDLRPVPLNLPAGVSV